MESIEPQWKKLADRLERGEKFLIMVVIKLRDDNFREIKFSDNQVSLKIKSISELTRLP